MDHYIEGFGSVPCVLCGHGICSCENEVNEDMIQTKEAFKDRIRSCKKCGHVWLKRIDEVLQCPNCKTARWDQIPLR